MPFIKKNKTNRGFTLIELLVVIAIIGVLASIVLVAMTGVRAQARDTVRKADMRQLITAQELYYGANNDYYTCSTTGGDCLGKPNNYPTTIADSNNTYMASTPEDPDPAKTYMGLDNTGDPQKFCYYVDLEGDGYYVASHAGTFEKSAAPTSLTDCATQ
jgi:prepilin-type N-terminal cleavage/methylation domain-containing protein